LAVGHRITTPGLTRRTRGTDVISGTGLLLGSGGEGLDVEIMRAACCHRLAKAVLRDAVGALRGLFFSAVGEWA
jgi:hypothetical protein